MFRLSAGSHVSVALSLLQASLPVVSEMAYTTRTVSLFFLCFVVQVFFYAWIMHVHIFFYRLRFHDLKFLVTIAVILDDATVQ